MTGSATFARSRDVAAAARERLDAAAAAAGAVEAARRELLRSLLELWPTSAWLAAGATSAKRWLLAYTTCSEHDAHRLERLGWLCHRHPTLADAILSGSLPLARAHRLGAAATPEREPWLADSLTHLLDLNETGGDDEAWSTVLRHWSSLVDQERDVRGVPRHSLTITQRLFGGGQLHADLSPSAFVNVVAALDARTDDPDPHTAPYQRPLGERRADALDDIACSALTGLDDPDDDGFDPDANELDGMDDILAEDTFDGFTPTDTLDEQLHHHDEDSDGDGLDPLEALRRQLRRSEQVRRRRARRRTRSRSGVRVNVHIDLRSLAGLRDLADLDELVLRGDGWTLTKDAAERLLCDSALVAVLFDGKGTLLDANDAAERWSRKQRHAIAARDTHCVFPSCQRPPRHCDIHHLHHRSDHGPTRTGNGALLCRFHHRLIHEYGWQLTIEDGHWIATDPHDHRWTGRPTTLPPTETDADADADTDGRPPDQPGAKTTR